MRNVRGPPTVVVASTAPRRRERERTCTPYRDRSLATKQRFFPGSDEFNSTPEVHGLWASRPTRLDRQFRLGLPSAGSSLIGSGRRERDSRWTVKEVTLPTSRE